MMTKVIQAVMKHANAPNFFGAVVACGFLWGQFAMQQTFHEGQRQISRSIETHSALLVSMQMQMLADDGPDYALLRSTLEDIRKNLRKEG